MSLVIMQKTVKFLKHYPKRDWNTDNFVCSFIFSVIDTHLIGTPHETETKHKLKVILSDRLMINWMLWDGGEDGIDDRMIKVAFQSAEDYISELIKSQTELGNDLPNLELSTDNSPDSCPYKISNITYPIKKSFEVNIESQSSILLTPSEVTKSSTKRLKVFLCHAKSDKARVRKLYEQLVNNGIDAWLDEEKLLPGQIWSEEIPKAVRNSDVVIVCLSKDSIDREGYVQKEIKIALDVADEKPEGTIFIIPLRLEECEVPERLNKYQWVDLYIDNGYNRLDRALNERFQQIIRNHSKSKLVIFPLNNHTYHSSMKDGPKLYSDKVVYFGTYRILKFSKNEIGKSLTVSVNSNSSESKLSIEVWRGVLDEDNYEKWIEERVLITRSPKKKEPSLEWFVEEGEYTTYFVSEGKYIQEYHIPGEIINYFDISYTIELL